VELVIIMRKKNILFISYFYPPYNSVGVKRVSYWVENISKYNYVPTVITACKQENKSDYVKYVPPQASSSFLSHLIKDEGVNWISNLKKELQNYPKDKFDYILITGGPFMHMLITKFLKSKFSAKLILDFRDPFYANPRFGSSRIKDSVKLYFQTKFLKYTDIVITVNQECAKLIAHPHIEIIDNGYDERVLLREKVQKNAQSNSSFSCLATGRVDDDFDIAPFFEAIKQVEETEFVYIGNQRFDKYDGRYKHGGLVSYSEALEYIANADLCVMFTGGLAFESSTKIFDYLALNKNLLIITKGEPRTGTLHEITKDYPNVFWAQNTSNKIKEAILEIKQHKHIEQDTSRFSRAEGLKKLIKILA